VSVRSSPFGPISVLCDERVLAPRAWTLAQSQRAAQRLEVLPPGPILELHCGAGHIGQVAAMWSDRDLVQVDDDDVCCAWAARNAADNGLPSSVVCARIGQEPFRDDGFVLVLADPPYVPTDETVRFPDDPRHAIDGGADGLDGIRACLPTAARAVRPGGVVLLQVRGLEQARRAARIAVDPACRLQVDDVVVVAADRAIVELVRV
jgi:methylase of polypeptide subunit release factors